MGKEEFSIFKDILESLDLSEDMIDRAIKSLPRVTASEAIPKGEIWDLDGKRIVGRIKDIR